MKGETFDDDDDVYGGVVFGFKCVNGDDLFGFECGVFEGGGKCVEVGGFGGVVKKKKK